MRIGIEKAEAECFGSESGRSGFEFELALHNALAYDDKLLGLVIPEHTNLNSWITHLSHALDNKVSFETEGSPPAIKIRRGKLTGRIPLPGNLVPIVTGYNEYAQIKRQLQESLFEHAIFWDRAADQTCAEYQVFGRCGSTTPSRFTSCTPNTTSPSHPLTQHTHTP